MDLSVYFEEAAQVSAAFIIGAIIGIEREFRSKPAGFRTMINCGIIPRLLKMAG